MSERRIMERFDEIMAGFDKHPYARLMERNTALEMLVIKQSDLLDECEKALRGLLSELTPYHFRQPFNHEHAVVTLAKLRSQEKADV